MCELARRDALNGRVVAAERQEKVDDAFAYACLLTALVDVLLRGPIKKDLGVGVIFVLGLGHFWLKGRVNQKDGSDAHLFKGCLHFCLYLLIAHKFLT